MGKSSVNFKKILISSLFFFKPIVDVFYQFGILDYIMFFLVLVLFCTNMKRRINIKELILMVLFFLLTISLLNNTNAFYIYVKMVSPVILYFGLRKVNIDYALKWMLRGYVVVVMINLLSIPMGVGNITWGSANTFKGFYFYKTDFAFAMSQAIVIFLCFVRKNKYLRLLIPISLIMLLMSNSRASMLVSIITIILYYVILIRNKEITFQFKTRHYFIIGILLIASLAVFNFIQNSEIFSSRNFITFDFTNAFSEGNTQGRSIIWLKIIELFKSHSILQQIFGVDLMSDAVINNGVTYGSHSSYLKMLYSTGYIGLVLFVLLIILMTKKTLKVSDKFLVFLGLSNIAAFVLNAITIATVQFTQFTWSFVMIYMFCINADTSNNNI